MKQTLSLLLSTCIIFACICLCTLCQADKGFALQEAPEPFGQLERRLIRDGFDKELIREIFRNQALQFDIETVSAYFRHREAALDYDQFLSPGSIQSARNYMKAHESALSRMESTYGVDKTIVTAIILVETRLGKYVGKRSVLNTLSTMAALSDEEARQHFWKNRPEDIPIEKERFEKKAARKSRWAYRELQAFIKHIKKEEANPHSVIGSYAGALGIAQFMPSNILAYARDGNRDGRIDLFDHADAIASIANYLKQHGWEPGLDKKRAKKVIYSYNHSSYYVDTILAIAEKLKG